MPSLSLEYQHCGNSPKQIFLNNFTIAQAKKNWDFITQYLTEDITWINNNQQTINGKINVIKQMKRLYEPKIKKLVVCTIITHGKYACVRKNLHNENNIQTFCEVYYFKSVSNTLIEKIETFSL